MVKGIFCHDLPIYKDINGVYCSNTLTNDVFLRYLGVVDELVVATRVYPINITYHEAGQDKISLPSLKFLDLPNLNTPKALCEVILDIRNKIEREISNLDLVFIRGGTIALIGVKVAKKLKKPYLLECGGSAWDSYWNHSLSGKILAPFMELKNRNAVRDAAMVVYVTKDWLQKKYPTNGVALGVSDVLIDIKDPEVLSRRLKHIEDIKGRQLVLGTTAAIDVKYKGQKYVIKAIKALKNYKNIRYEVVGGGNSNYLKNIAEQYGVKEKILFKGQLTHDEVLEWLDNIDIYIQPSLTEGLPRALVEAMSRGCPSLGSDVGGIPELLSSEFLFEKKNSKELTDRIINIISGDLAKAAKVNYQKAKEYTPEILDIKRQSAFKQYRKIVMGD